MIIQLKINDINPCEDVADVLARIHLFLNQCDPSDRPNLKIEYPLP